MILDKLETGSPPTTKQYGAIWTTKVTVYVSKLLLCIALIWFFPGICLQQLYFSKLTLSFFQMPPYLIVKTPALTETGNNSPFCASHVIRLKDTFREWGFQMVIFSIFEYVIVFLWTNMLPGCSGQLLLFLMNKNKNKNVNKPAQYFDVNWVSFEGMMTGYLHTRQDMCTCCN